VSCLLCGEKDERSKVPSWRCVTGMSRGASSEDIDGVRTRTEGLAIVVDAPWRCG